MDPKLLNEATIAVDHDQAVLHLTLGRMLTDRGFRDLFEYDPQRAAEILKISLTPETIAKLRGYLGRLNSASPAAQGVISSEINALERWKQY